MSGHRGNRERAALPCLGTFGLKSLVPDPRSSQQIRPDTPSSLCIKPPRRPFPFIPKPHITGPDSLQGAPAAHISTT